MFKVFILVNLIISCYNIKMKLDKLMSGVILLVVGIGITLVKGDIPGNLLSLMEWLYSAFILHGAVVNYNDNKFKRNKE